MPSAGKILVIRGGAIGDFILTLPVLSALRERFPDAHIEVLGYPNVTALALASRLADGSRSIESRALARFFAPRVQLDPEFCDYFSQFALIFSYLYDPDKFFETNVRSCFKGQFIVGPHRPSDPAVHATDAFLTPLQALAIFDADPHPRLALPPADLPQGRWVALHPGSGSERKNWPVSAWIQFAHSLQAETNCGLIIVGGEAEGGKLDLFEDAAFDPARTKVLRSLPLVEVAGHLAACHAFAGHDSGISHLAGAVSLPGLILWGETNPSVWRPRSAKLQLVEAGAGLAVLTPAEVLRSFRSVLSV